MRDTRKPSSAVKGRAVINETDYVFQLIGSARNREYIVRLVVHEV